LTLKKRSSSNERGNRDALLRLILISFFYITVFNVSSTSAEFFIA
jgi:hypothetical protein